MPEVPPFKQYFANVAIMDDKQKSFFNEWLRAWKRGTAINVNGQISYLFCYVYDVIGKGAKNAISELIRIRNAYQNEKTFLPYCDRWISDCYAILGLFKDAIDAFPLLKPDARSSFSTDLLLSLKVKANYLISGRDILTLCGPQVTEFGKKNLDSIAQYLEIGLRAREHSLGITILEEWKKDTSKKPYQVFTGTIYSSTTTNLEYYSFSTNSVIVNSVQLLTREAENTVREEIGIPLVGEGWVGETELYYAIKKNLAGFDVKQHARPEWLSGQHLDIFIPKLNLAIEYQGTQHQIPVKYFGGEEAFRHRRFLDRKKAKLCRRNNIRLVYVYPGYLLDEIMKEIRENGVL